MKRIFLFLTILGLLNSSCKNAFEEMSSKDTDAAILYAARMHLSAGEWTEALSEFARLSSETLATTEVVIDRASAYSGRCGLDFLNLADMIGNIGSDSLMQLLMENFPASDASNLADCRLAEDLLKTVADSNGVVENEKGRFLMAFNSLAKIGVILSHRGDSNDDGTVNAGWDPCDNGTGTTDLPNADLNEIATGIVLFYKNLLGFEFGSDLTSAIDSLCTAIDSTAADFCDQENTTGITADHRVMIRSIVVETDDGIGLSILAGGMEDNVVQCM